MWIVIPSHDVLESLNMDLNGIKVLVDGYNLELQHGAGIKTYGLNLIEVLNRLNAKVFVLSSRRGSTRDPLLNEILFFDHYQKEDRDARRLSLLKSLVKSIASPRKLKEVSFSNRVLKNPDDNELFNDLEGVFAKSECYRAANIWFKLTGMVTQLKGPQIDIWHATMPLPIRIKNAKKITTIHDLIPLIMPYVTLDNKKFFYRCIQESLQHSDLVIADSESTRKDILNFFDCNPDKICVAYPSIVFMPVDSEEISKNLQKYGLKPKGYVLFVGAIEPRKNLVRLFDAYAAMDTEKPLVVVGKRAWLWEEAVKSGERLSGRVKFLDYVPSRDLGYLYSGALFFIFPSLYEGFGLPPLEAMFYGCPVITSNVSSLPEVCGNAALYIDPYDILSIKDAIQALLESPKMREKLSEAGKKRSEIFNVENCARALYSAYRKIL